MKNEKSQLGKSGLEVSRLGLGTVEIGIPGYGVEKKDFINEKDAIYLLESAVDMGVTYIDTARGYGVAEERIGKSNISTRKEVIVGTKCGQFLKQTPNMPAEDLEKKIREEINESRRLLGYDTLPLVQLHIELPDYTNLDVLVEIMNELKAEEKVAHVGIATRGYDVPRAAINSEFFETIQLAYSILDQRMSGDDALTNQNNESSESGSTPASSNNILALAGASNIGIINRSVLLQGSLTPARTHLPSELSTLKANADAAATIADELGISLPSLAMRFSISNPHVSTCLLGTTKPRRLEEALAAIEMGPLDTEVLARLYPLSITDESQVDPSKWPK